jgi:hypothetical protein
MTNHPKKAPAAEPAQAPVKKLRFGLVQASIWERRTEAGTFYAARFERRYQDNEGQWQSTHSYNTDDLLELAKLADQAHTEIMRLRAGKVE